MMLNRLNYKWLHIQEEQMLCKEILHFCKRIIKNHIRKNCDFTDAILKITAPIRK